MKTTPKTPVPLPSYLVPRATKRSWWGIGKFLLIAVAGVSYVALDAILTIESMDTPYKDHTVQVQSAPQVTAPQQQELTTLVEKVTTPMLTPDQAELTKMLIKVNKIQDRHPSLVKTQDRIVGGEE